MDHDSTSTKRCSACAITKPHSAFNRFQRSPDGLQSRCRECANAANLAWRREHRNHRVAYQAAYHAAHQGRLAEHRKAYRAANPDLFNARMRTWRATYPDTYRHAEHARRARKVAATVLGPVDYAEIRQRDRGVCYLCNKAITRDDRVHYDHAIALARGGENSTRNVRITHSLCNQRKRHNDVPHQPFLF